MRSLQSTSAPLLLSLAILSGHPLAIQGAKETIRLCVRPDKTIYKMGEIFRACWPGDIQRSADLFVPDSIKGQDEAPLVMNLHALGSNSFFQQLYTQFDETAEENGFMVLYPNGFSTVDIETTIGAEISLPLFTWNAGGCCSAEPVDDIDFLRKLFEYVKKGKGIENTVKVDEERVYVTGMSNGGFMTNRVACEMSDIIAAAVPVAGPLMQTYNGKDNFLGLKHPFGWEQTDDTSFTCDPTNPVPLLHIHSIQDNIVPYGGTEYVLNDDVVLPVAESIASFFADLPDIIPKGIPGKETLTQLSDQFLDIWRPAFSNLDDWEGKQVIVGSLLALFRINELGFPSVNSSIANWRRINNVKDTESTSKTFGGGIKNDRGVECFVYNDKKPGRENHAPVELCSINSSSVVGHCWPGKEFLQCGNEGVNNDYIWEFMSRYKKANVGGEAVSVPVSGSDEL